MEYLQQQQQDDDGLTEMQLPSSSHHTTVSVRHVALLKHLNISSLPIDTYNEKNIGPIKPGISFYKHLLSNRGPKLSLPIPDTILIDDDKMVRRIYTDNNGFVQVSERINGNDADARDALVAVSIDSILSSATPMTKHVVKSSYGQNTYHEPLSDRVVAVCKKPLLPTVYRGNLRINNSIDILNPMAFHAQLLSLTEGDMTTACIQQYIKPKGNRPTVYRCFWKATSLGVGTIIPWRITKATETMKVVPNSEGKKRVNAINGERDSGLDDEILILNMKSNLDMPMTDRNIAMRDSLHMNRVARSTCVCSITDDKGDVRLDTASQLVVTRVSAYAMEEVASHIQKLVYWMQVLVQRTEGLVLYITDMICDFIRDEKGKWWFIQLKGYDIHEVVRSKVQYWHTMKCKGYDVRQLHKGNSTSEIRQKLERERGLKCKMCGRNFQEGQVICIEMSSDILEGDTFATTLIGKYSDRHQTAGRSSTREVPAYGYILSTRAACRLAELFRDSGIIPLTKYARHLLSAFSLSLETRTISEALNRFEAKDHTDVHCCFYCCRINEERDRYINTCSKLYHLLGIKIESDAEETFLAGRNANGNNGIRTLRRPKSAAAATTTATATIKRLHIGKVNMPVVSEKIRSMTVNFNAKGGELPPLPRKAMEPLTDVDRSTRMSDIVGGLSRGSWRSDYFRQHTLQYKLFVMAHMLTDFNLPDAYKNSIGCISYMLGQCTQLLYFDTSLEGSYPKDSVSSSKDTPLYVKQCRVHYVCGQPVDMKCLFADKAIDVHLSFVPNRGNILSATSRPVHEATVQLKLGSLNFAADKCVDGTQKVDYSLRFQLKSVSATMTLKLSIAVIASPTLPWQLGEVKSFMREKLVYWPPDMYHDCSPLPEVWLSMLHTTRGARDTSITAAVDSTDTAIDGVAIDDATNSVAIASDTQGITGSSASSDLAFLNQFHVFIENSATLGLAHAKHAFALLHAEMTAKVVADSYYQQTHDDCHDGNGSNDPNNSANDSDVVKTYTLIERILSSKPCNSNADDPTGQECSVLMSLAMEQLLHQDSLPSTISWPFFLQLLNECLAWAKMQRQKVHMTRLDALDDATGVGDGTNDHIHSHAKSPASAQASPTAQKIARYLDVLKHVQHLQATRVGNDSTTRWTRRMLYALDIIEPLTLATGDMDMIPVPALHDHLHTHASNLKRVIELVQDGSIDFPLVHVKFIDDIARGTNCFSLVKSIIAAQLLTLCPSLQYLFTSYRESKTTFISVAGFLKSVEECIRLVSEDCGNHDPTLTALRSLLTERDTQRRRQAKASGVMSSAVIRSTIKDMLDVEEGSYSDDFVSDVLMQPHDTSTGKRRQGSNSNSVANVKQPPPGTVSKIFLCCQMHGYEYFYLADACCEKCEQEELSIEQEEREKENLRKELLKKRGNSNTIASTKSHQRHDGDGDNVSIRSLGNESLVYSP